MKIHVNVNQARCIRLGVDAPQSSVDIEVDPAKLTPSQREWVAGNLRQGYRLDAIGAIAPPTLAGLIDAIDERLADELAEAEAAAAARAQHLARDIAAARKALDSPPERENVAVGFDPETGEPSFAIGHVRRHVETVVDEPFRGYKNCGLPDDLLAEIEIERVRRAAIRKHEIAAALPQLHAEYLAERSKKLEEERAIKAARLDLLRRAGRGELVERIEAGVAPHGEMERAIADIVESDIMDAMRLDGIREMSSVRARALSFDDWERERDIKELTAERWAFAKRVKKSIDASGCLQDVEWDYSIMTTVDGDELFAVCLYRTVAGVDCVVRLVEVAS